MAKYKITAPDGNSYEVTAPDSASQDQVLAYAKSNYQKAAAPSIAGAVNKSSNPLSMLAQAAPSNMLKNVGVASANAPGIANLAINSIPGIGNPGQIMPSIQNIQRNPGQAGQAMNRVAQVGGGAPMSPQERIPGNMGQAAGTAIEMMAPNLGTQGMKATSPFMAGVKDPGTALPGAFERAGQELGAAKTVARVGEDPREALRLRAMLSKPAGIAKVAEEGLSAMKSGKDVSTTHLMAYREALGKMQQQGGTFANDYKAAKDVASQMLAKKAPGLMPKMEQMANNYVARDNPKKTFPWFTTALDPTVGLAKATTLPGVQNALGAAASPIPRFPGQISSLLNQALKKLRRNEDPDTQR